jgi:nucleoside-diphosphate-sugar epimerase
MVGNSKKILMTGATGFLGSQLLKSFLRLGHEVSILKRTNSVLDRINECLGEVNVYDLECNGIEETFSRNEPYDCIVHAATCYGRNGERNTTLLQANLVFPVTLLEKAVDNGVGVFFNISTSLPANLNLYALSKKQFEEWGKSFAASGTIKFSNLIYEHIYGPGDSDNKFTTYLLKNCLNNVNKLDLTDGKQRRDFIYVDDAVSAFISVFNETFRSNVCFQEYEVGSGEAVAIRDLAKLVKELTGAKTKLNFGAVSKRKNEVEISLANTEKLKETGWNQKISLREGLLRSIKGYQK